MFETRVSSVSRCSPLALSVLLCLLASAPARARRSSGKPATEKPPAAGKADASTPRFVILSNDWRLNSEENATMTAAVAAVARKLGKDAVPPDRARPVLERLRQGLREDGPQCRVPRSGGDEELAALAADSKVCGGGPCELRQAAWNIECSEKWGACAVELTFRSATGSGDEDDTDDDAMKPRPEYFTWRIAQGKVQRFKTVADLATALAATRVRDWKAAGGSEGVGGILGGLGLGGLDSTGWLERAVESESAELEVEREASSSAPVWSLLKERPWNVEQQDRRIAVDLASIPCLDHPQLESSTRVFARRSGRGFDVEVESAQAEVRACLQPVVEKALAGESKSQTMINLSLKIRRGDVVTSDGRYIISLSLNQERTQDRDWRKQKPRVSDPALQDWRLPRDGNPFKKCLVDFPFDDTYALKDHGKRTRLDFYYEVHFDEVGHATKATFLLPAKKNTTAEQIVDPARRCVEAAALKSLAPCTSQGGTARAWLSGSVTRVKSPAAASE
ncbi:MAG: hypothetical protein ABIJ09_01000 [Pseudomonadota bacterium]